MLHYQASSDTAHCRLQAALSSGLQPETSPPSQHGSSTTPAVVARALLRCARVAPNSLDRKNRSRSRAARTLCAFAGALAIAACAPRRHPGPNDAYRDPRVSAAVWNHYFEDDGRGEIYQQRHAIVRLAAVKPGMRVADVGAGTGLFSMLLSDAVGPDGVVYAEEIVDRFSRYIAERAEHEKRPNVVSVLGTETGIGLPPHSVDLAFLCDVYHHFDHPAPMLASIRNALRDDGELFVVDFIRETGRSPEWVFEHVRASEATVKQEIERAGFVLLAADHEFRDSYALRFRRGGTVD